MSEKNQFSAYCASRIRRLASHCACAAHGIELSLNNSDMAALKNLSRGFNMTGNGFGYANFIAGMIKISMCQMLCLSVRATHMGHRGQFSHNGLRCWHVIGTSLSAPSRSKKMVHMALSMCEGRLLP